MEETWAPLLQGALLGAGLVGAMFTPIVARSRHSAPRKLAKAEEDIRSRTNLRETHYALRILDVKEANKIFVPKKVRERAKYLIQQIETEYGELIGQEVMENLPRLEQQFNISLGNGDCYVSSVSRNIPLEDISKTYRDHFLPPAEET